MVITFDEAIKRGLAQIPLDFVAYAKAEHSKIMELDPRPDSFLRWVDGVQDAPEERVRPDGVIVYEYNRLDLIAQRVLDTLRKNSPVKSGDYVRSHTLFLNGAEVQDLKAWKQGDEIAITNYVPYSRKIELGKMKMSVPGHVYEKSAQIMRRYFKDIADINFTYRGIVNGVQIDQFTASDNRRRGANGKFAANGGVQSHNKSVLRYPTITINPAGTTQRRIHGR